MSQARKKVAIVGAGIMGISTAICLQDSDPCLDLTIIAEEFSPDHLTSDIGAGLWSSIPGIWMKNTAKHKQRQWGEATFHYLKSLIEFDTDCLYKLSYTTGYVLYDHVMHEEPDLKDVCLYYKRLSKEDIRKLGFSSDLIDGFTMKSMMFPGTPYLQIKLGQFQENGGKVVKRKVHSFAEFAGKFDVVVNCSGLGSRELCDDTAIQPARGHILRIHAPWIKHSCKIIRKNEFMKGRYAYVYPRFHDVIVGGTSQRGNWDRNVDDRETEAILDRVSEFEPTIRNGKIINQCVGLRPFRDSVRLETEVMNVKTPYGLKVNLPIVHNYGHGGAGLSLFWGCAEEAKDLVQHALLRSGL